MNIFAHQYPIQVGALLRRCDAPAALQPELRRSQSELSGFIPALFPRAFRGDH